MKTETLNFFTSVWISLIKDCCFVNLSQKRYNLSLSFWEKLHGYFIS